MPVCRQLLMGFAFGALALAGCGGSREVVSTRANKGETPANAEGEMPEPVALGLTDCARQGAARLRLVEYAVRFNVHVERDGRASVVEVASSTLEDGDLEACMKGAFAAVPWTASLAAMRSTERDPEAFLPTHSRTLIAQGSPPPTAPVMVGPLRLFIRLAKGAGGVALVAGEIGAGVAAGGETVAGGAAAAGGAVIAGIGVVAAIFFYAKPTGVGPGEWTRGPSAGPIPAAPPVAAATAMPTTTAPTMPTTLTLPDQALWRQCNQQHDAYKKTDKEDFPNAKQMRPLLNLLLNNKASAQEGVDFCLVLDKRIELAQREHKERSKYIKDDCDKFDWFNEGKTKAQRLAQHQIELKNVDAQLKNFYELKNRFCK